jgi:hypothetical protein
MEVKNKRYLVCPGYVRSRHDGDLHYVGARELIQLYGVDPADCLIQGQLIDPTVATGLKRLIPRFSGDYRLRS